MNADLLSLARDALGSDFYKLAGQFLGESQASTQTALSSLLPVVVGAMAQKGATPEGASRLISLANSTNLDANAPGNVAALFSGEAAGIKSMLKAGTSSLVPALFGDKSGALVNALSSASGVKSSSATNLLAMVVPLVLALLKKLIGDQGLSASSLASLLAGQARNLQGAIDSRLTGALGFSSPAAFLGGLGERAAEATARTGAHLSGATSGISAGTAAAATSVNRSPLARWLPWVIAAAVLLFLWNMFAGRAPAPPTASAPTASAPPPASAPTVVASGLPAKIYFDVGAAAIGPEASKTLTAVADTIRKDNAKVVITGYTDKTGDAAKNEKLAKDRAVATRDALMAAGVADSSIDMRPPMFVESGAGTSDAEARRVEINRQ
jgi:hypothetical protein